MKAHAIYFCHIYSVSFMQSGFPGHGGKIVFMAVTIYDVSSRVGAQIIHFYLQMDDFLLSEPAVMVAATDFPH